MSVARTFAPSRFRKSVKNGSQMAPARASPLRTSWTTAESAPLSTVTSLRMSSPASFSRSATVRWMEVFLKSAIFWPFRSLMESIPIPTRPSFPGAMFWLPIQ